MSAEHVPLHCEIDHLLNTCRGGGAVVAVMPAGNDPANHHHFYAGVARAPALSFLEALLLALGGTLEDGSRRYEEIVVVSAGRTWSAGNLSQSDEEVFRLSTAAGPVARGGDWGAWWYRRPAEAPAEAPREPNEGGRPDPRARLRGEGRRTAWSGVAADPAGRPSGGVDFPLQISDTEQGIHFPKRYEELKRILETLDGRAHRVLLLVDLGVLDYASPDRAPTDHININHNGSEKMVWFSRWINERSGSPRHLDVLLYSRNRQIVDAFLGSGLPRRPRGEQGPWPAVAYQGHNLRVVEYPCGAYPWGERLFDGDGGFRREDGTSTDSPEARRRYANRTLKSLLRGQGTQGRDARLRFAIAVPEPPPRPDRSDLIDRDFWSRIDVPLLRQALRREYFGADENQAVVTLLETIEFMQQQARSIHDPQSFHNSVRERWAKASALLLWGEGGVGKSYIGKLLAPLVYGVREPLLISCQEIGGGYSEDPAAGFRDRFFGFAAGYHGGDRLTAAGRHIADTMGFTVLVIDEVAKIAKSFVDSMEILFGILEDRKYLPKNTALTGDRPISLWNTIFVLTSNLESFPPPGVPQQNREAIRRRLSAHQMKVLNEEGRVAFAQWFLPRALEERLGGVAVCTCGDLRREIESLRIGETSPDMVRKELAPFADRAFQDLEQAGISNLTAPLFLDVTDPLRRALR